MYTELEKNNSHASPNRFPKVGRRIDFRFIYAWFTFVSVEDAG